MRGLEVAFWATLGADPELKMSKGGKPFATMNAAVIIGKDDAGRDVTQWVRVACFGDVAEQIAAKARKGDRLYVEGQLTLNTWADKATGEAKTGLNVAAWKCEKVPGIGKNRERRDHDSYSANTGKPGQYRREKPRIAGLDDFNDEIGF